MFDTIRNTPYVFGAMTVGGEEYGDGQATLRDLNRGIGPWDADARGLDPDGSTVVRARCHTGQVESELAVQLSRQSVTTPSAEHLRVAWVPGTDAYSSGRRIFVVPATFTLCSVGDHQPTATTEVARARPAAGRPRGPARRVKGGLLLPPIAGHRPAEGSGAADRVARPDRGRPVLTAGDPS